MPQVVSFYHPKDVGGSAEEVLLLELLLRSWGCCFCVEQWAAAIVDDVRNYTDGDPWDIPAAWKQGETGHFIVKTFAQYISDI